MAVDYESAKLFLGYLNVFESHWFRLENKYQTESVQAKHFTEITYLLIIKQ